MATARYLTSLKQDRKKFEQLTLTEAADLSHCRGGTQQTLYEFLDENHDYVPFTDSDIYLESKEPPTQDFVRKVLDSIFQNLYRLVGSQSPENADFKMATRHGLVEEKGVYKLSFRCYLFGFKIKLKDMRDLIVNKGLHKNGLGSFDIAPYNKSQLLGCVGFAKSQTDGRMLLPTVEASSEPGVLEGFMVQNLTGEEPTLTNDDDTPIEANNSDHAEGELEMDLKHSSSRFCPPWDLLEKCIMALSVDRRCKKGTYHEWTRVGWAIAGCARAANRTSDGLDLWLRFCKQCDVYYETSCSAISVFSRASNQGRQLGWNSLMEALKEDAHDVHRDIENQLFPAIKEQKALTAIKKFVKASFGRPIPQIQKVFVTTYGADKYIIVNLKPGSGCNFIDEDHDDGTQNYIVIGSKTARNKCSHPSCTGRSDAPIPFAQYPENIKSFVLEHLRVVQTPRDIVQEFVRQHKDSSFTEMADNDLEIEDPQPVLFGHKYPLTKNRYCQICKCSHDKPENCIFMNQTATLMALGCRLNSDNFHPPGGISIPQNITNIVVNQTVQTGSTAIEIQPLLSADYIHDNLPLFQDDAVVSTAFMQSFSSHQYDVAFFAQALWGAEFRFFHHKWHRFQNHIWEPLTDAPILRHRLSSVLCKFYSEAQAHYRNNGNAPRGKDKIVMLDRLIGHLKTVAFKDNVMKELKELSQIANEGFAAEVNKADLLPFTNGVLDLSNSDFRPGRPEDKMSLTTHVAFEPFDESVQDCQDLRQFIQSIMPDETVREFLLKISSLCLSRGVKHQTFTILTEMVQTSHKIGNDYISITFNNGQLKIHQRMKGWTDAGKGANGKSLYLDLMSAMLGDFAKTAPTTLLTGKREAASGTNEALVDLDGARLATFNEPESMGTIQADVMKSLAGGRDKISARGLHEKMRTFTPTFKMFLACNIIPRMSEDTLAVWRRVQVIHFPMTFCEEPDGENPFEALIDVDLGDEKLHRWAPYLASYLLPYYKSVHKNGLNKPSAVERSTQTYRQNCDPYAEFWTECMIYHGKEKKNIKWAQKRETLDAFRDWLRSQNLKLTGAECRAYLESRFSNCTRGNERIYGYEGYTIRDMGTCNH